MQIYLRNSPLQQGNNVPKLLGIDYVAKELGTSSDVKSFAISGVHVLLLKEEIMISVKKNVKKC